MKLKDLTDEQLAKLIRELEAKLKAALNESRKRNGKQRRDSVYVRNDR